MNQIFGPGAHEDLFEVRNVLNVAADRGNYGTHKLVIVAKKARTEINSVDEWVLQTVDHQINKHAVYELEMTYKDLDDWQLKCLSDA